RIGVDSLSYEDENFKLSLTRNPAPQPAQYGGAVAATFGNAVANGNAQNTEPSETAAGNFVTVSSPCVGTAYRAREPGKAPLVSLGDTVQAGDPLCVIEAMKTFSEIPAPCAGVVVEIGFEDGQLAEYGAPLVVLEVEPGERSATGATP
ncbi:MAG: hypothetical protein LBC65_01365, partial [Oscillospiraceae bacterium]|nr:hypothetical protein [Oscillospiraceae bacterium]